MRVFSDFIEILPGLTSAQLGTMIILSAFGLAAFAIYAVFKIAQKRTK